MLPGLRQLLQRLRGDGPSRPRLAAAPLSPDPPALHVADRLLVIQNVYRGFLRNTHCTISTEMLWYLPFHGANSRLLADSPTPGAIREALATPPV